MEFSPLKRGNVVNCARVVRCSFRGRVCVSANTSCEHRLVTPYSRGSKANDCWWSAGAACRCRWWQHWLRDWPCAVAPVVEELKAAAVSVKCDGGGVSRASASGQSRRTSWWHCSNWHATITTGRSDRAFDFLCYLPKLLRDICTESKSYLSWSFYKIITSTKTEWAISLVLAHSVNRAL